MNQNIFDADWRACLRAHYAHVVQQADTNNETSLITVLQWTGFSPEEITQMRRETLKLLGLPDDPALEVVEIEAPIAEVDEQVEELPILETSEELEVVVAEPVSELIEPQAEIESEIDPEIEFTEPETTEPEAAKPDDDEPAAPPVQMTLF